MTHGPSAAWALILMTLGACAAPGVNAPPDPHDVQAAAPGRPTCMVTRPTENAAGATATNRARAQGRLAPVAPNMLLAQVAADHACDMAGRGLMAHRGSRTTGPAQRVKERGYVPTITAENIAAGPYDLSEALAEWNASAKHRANLMIPQMRDYGIGRAIGSDGRTVFWAAVYGAPRAR